MPAPRDITGQRFGRLVAVNVAETNTGRGRLWKCVCDCGLSIRVHAENLLGGNTQSCGCRKLDLLRRRSTTHGKAPRNGRHPLYVVWAGMVARCTNPQNRCYHLYGGRGITVSREWLSFGRFYADMGNGYAKGLQLDRVDNDGNYSKANCRWATPSQNAYNRRPKRKVS